MFDYDSTAVASILGTSLDAVFTIDDQGRIVDLNDAAVRLFGRSREEFLGSNIACIVPPPHKEKHDGYLAAFRPDRGVKHVLGSGQRLDAERKDGSRFPVEVGISAFLQDGRRYFTGFVRDMSERQRNEDHLRYLASHDAVTGLLNYRGFCASPLPPDAGARVVFFRLEEFRRLVTSYTRDWGDATLREFARRVQDFLAPGEVAARVREDAFAILVPADALGRAATLRRALGMPVSHGGMGFTLTCTLGISRPLGNVEQRLHDAQLACERGCRSGKGSINEFDEAMCRQTARELRIESRLRDAVANGGLSLALQPKVRLADRRIAGAEALVRWVDDELGPVPPSEFIPVAERFGMIGAITDWMLNRSVEELAQGADRDITIAVNFSALDFLQPRLVAKVEGALAARDVNPAQLVMELTETVLASDVALVEARMREIKSLGVALSLDDFGTGYSSLSYLRQFPIDSLKIDISFVRELPAKADAVAIATAIVAMARALELDTIAEGVENEAQAAILQGLGVDLCQGFLFCRPVAAAAFRHLVATQPYLTRSA